MKKTQQTAKNGNMQLSFSFNISNSRGHLKEPRIIQLKDFRKKSLIGYVLKNSKSF